MTYIMNCVIHHEKAKQLEKENHDLNILAKRLLSKNKIYYECELYKAKNDELFGTLQSFTKQQKYIE